MIEVKKGDAYIAQGVRSGVGDRGKWFLCRVSGEKKSDKITLWNYDGFTCTENDTVKITDILSVKQGMKKGKGQYADKWFHETDVVCKLEVASAATNPFSELDGEQSFIAEAIECDPALPF